MAIQTILAAVFYLVIIFLSLLLLRQFAKAHTLLLLPITYTFLTFTLYIMRIFINNPYLIIFFSIIAFMLLVKFFKSSFPRADNHLPPKYFFIIIFALTFLIMIPRISIPLFSLSSDVSILPSIGDETKHLSALTSITASQKFVPPFPYDPSMPFIYYYLYYLFPAVILKIFTHANMGFIWFEHLLITQLGFFSVFLYLTQKLTKKNSSSLLALLLVTFGTSLKFFPKVFKLYGVTEPHIEHWFQIPSNGLYNSPSLVGWQISHPITVAVWTPQHEFGAMTALLFLAIILEKRLNFRSFLLLSIILTVVFGSSAFIGIGLLGLFLLFALLRVKSKAFFFSSFISVFLFFIFVLPFIFLMRDNQASISFKPYLPTAPFLPKILGVPLFYLIETGFTIPILLYLVFRYLKSKKTVTNSPFLFLILGFSLPLIISRLFQSAFMNDFDMRIPILYTIFAPLLIVFLLEELHLTKRVRTFIVSTLIISVVISSLAGFLEVYYQTKKIEKYPLLASQIYKVVTRSTFPSDIIVVNDAYTADRIPVLSSRLTLKQNLPFSLDVYLPKRVSQGDKFYSTELCDLYKKIKGQNLPYHFTYLELQNYPLFQCDELTAAKNKARIIYSSPSMILYRL